MTKFRKLKRFGQKFRRAESGAAAIEFSLVAGIFVLATMGVIELGRTYQVRNELAYAADIGGRKLTIIVNTPDIDEETYATQVRDVIVSNFNGYDSDDLSVSVDPEIINGVQYQKLTLEYPMSVFIPFQTDTYQLKIVRRAVQL